MTLTRKAVGEVGGIFHFVARRRLIWPTGRFRSVLLWFGGSPSPRAGHERLSPVAPTGASIGQAEELSGRYGIDSDFNCSGGTIRFGNW